MALELRDQPPAFGLPHSRRLVLACGDDAATIGAIRRAHDAVPMALELSDQPPAVGLPHPRRLVLARGDDAVSYTHLDVYKRQSFTTVLPLAMGPGRTANGNRVGLSIV